MDDCLELIWNFADLPTQISLGHIDRHMYKYCNMVPKLVRDVMTPMIFEEEHLKLFDWLWDYGYNLSPTSLIRIHCSACCNGRTDMIMHLLKYQNYYNNCRRVSKLEPEQEPKQKLESISALSFWGKQCENIRSSRLDRIVQDEIIAQFHRLGCKCAHGNIHEYAEIFYEKFCMQ